MGLYSEWIESKKILAQKLGEGALGASYAEGAIILCAAISTMSSLLWGPERGKDHRKFCETLKIFCHVEPHLMRVSSPLLAFHYQETKSLLGISEIPVYYDQDVDKSEEELTKLFTERNIIIPSKCIRKYSYINLLYKEVRNGFSHEYLVGASASDYDPLRDHPFVSHRTQSRIPKVSYVNKGVMLNKDSEMTRLFYFPLGWISFVAEKVAFGMDLECDRQNKSARQNLDLTLPPQRWIDGV
ncbi:MAG: hypothetical protein ACRYG6_08470 [Janthinobacterium lividum]